MLFYPLDEQSDVPPGLVECCNGQRWKHGIVLHEYQGLYSIGGFESYSSQVFGVVLSGVVSVECNHLIANDASRTVGWRRVNAVSIHALFCSGDKESAKLMNPEKPGVVHIAAVHDVKSADLYLQDVQHVHVCHLPVADMDKGRNIASQIQKRVQLYCRFRCAKWGPIEQAQAKIYRCRVERVNRRVQVGQRFLFGLELSCFEDQSHRKCVINSPVSRVQSIRQGRAIRNTLDPHVKQFLLIRRETNLDVPQRLSPSKLSKGHHTKDVCARQSANTRVPVVAFDDATEVFPRHKFHDLSEKSLAFVHD